MEINKEKVLEALKKVRHPEQGKDIVQLGMVADLRVQGDDIHFVLKSEKPNDPLLNSIQKAATKVIKTLVPASAKVRISVPGTTDPGEEDQILSGVKNIIAVASGKGGVGKSTIAANLAVAVSSLGYRTGLIDADIYGPSIPKMLSAEDTRPSIIKKNGKEMIVPVEPFGVKMISIGFFIEPDDPLVWRGPMATNALRQFISQGDWGGLDYLFVDTPPGTSDIHLTLVQEVPVTGAVIVSTPQKVALADAIKGINMFRGEKINVPVLGLIENMSWFTPAELPDKRYYIFGREGCKQLAEKYNVRLLGQIPIVQSIREGGDRGQPSVLDEGDVTGEAFMQLARNVIDATEERNKNLPASERLRITRK